MKYDTQSYIFCHLYYVDDLKLYADSEVGFERLLKFTFSKDIKMQRATDKCAKRGKIQTYDNVVNENNVRYLITKLINIKIMSNLYIKKKQKIPRK